MTKTPSVINPFAGKNQLPMRGAQQRDRKVDRHRYERRKVRELLKHPEELELVESEA